MNIKPERCKKTNHIKCDNAVTTYLDDETLNCLKLLVEKQGHSKKSIAARILIQLCLKPFKKDECIDDRIKKIISNSMLCEYVEE